MTLIKSIKEFKECIEKLLIKGEKKVININLNLLKIEEESLKNDNFFLEKDYRLNFLSLIKIDEEFRKKNSQHIEKEYLNRIIGLSNRPFEFTKSFYSDLLSFLSNEKIKIDSWNNLEELLFLSLIKEKKYLSTEIVRVGDFIKGKILFFSLTIEERNQVIKIKDDFFKEFVATKISYELIDQGIEKLEVQNLSIIYISSLSNEFREKVSERLQNYLEFFYLGEKEEKIIKDIFIRHSAILKYDYKRTNKIKIKKIGDINAK